ncbi:MAG: TetR/AcrR family transcriptional regulator [Proteobacteria bacterium]|nr:TetR/AcrR family transcriptional regulator [Pseudomonadota bacterium]
MSVSPDLQPERGQRETGQREAAPRESAAARSRAATRARLLESGQQLFAARGFHGVTSHEIARGAGVAAGTFYLHFRDKGALFREIVEATVAALRARLDAAFAEAGEERAIQARARARVLVDFAAQNREVMRMLFSGDAEAASVGSDVLDRLAESIAASRRRRLAASGGGHVTAGDDLDPAVVAQAVVGMWARVLAWWTEDPSRATPETLVDTLTRIQLSGTHPT